MQVAFGRVRRKSAIFADWKYFAQETAYPTSATGNQQHILQCHRLTAYATLFRYLSQIVNAVPTTLVRVH